MSYRALKTYSVKAEPLDDEGTFEALVSIFGNVDLVGDRVVKGAFAKSLERWESSGDPIPVIWSHQWSDPQAHLGEVLEADERDDGLWIKGRLDLEDRGTYAGTIWRKMKRRLIKEFSFAYDVVDEGKAKDGANELREVELIEVGPCLKGINPDTQLLAAKAGRILSAKNEQSIRDAVRMLQNVLAQLDAGDGADDGAKPGAKPEKSGEELSVRSAFSLLVLAEADALD